MLYTNSIIIEEPTRAVYLAYLGHLMITSNCSGGMLGNQCQCGIGIQSILTRLIVCKVFAAFGYHEVSYIRLLSLFTYENSPIELRNV
jgi:hypothetical protein